MVHDAIACSAQYQELASIVLCLVVAGLHLSRLHCTPSLVKVHVVCFGGTHLVLSQKLAASVPPGTVALEQPPRLSGQLI